MDYKKKYKESLALMVDCIPDEDGYVHVRPQDIFPELRESEDEKIRKEISELIMQPTWQTEKEFNRRKEIVDWIEKQGEQKPPMQNGITINGVEYELIEDNEADECERCALREKCHYSNEVICTQIFENLYAHHRFEKRTK
jgi:hypothetical protein